MRNSSNFDRGREFPSRGRSGHSSVARGTARSEVHSQEAAARPFIKWVGGKRQLLAELRKYVPQGYGTLHEPFVGGGALFFSLRPARAVLSDTNERLVRAYRGVRNDVETVIQRLRSYPHDKAFFLRMREFDVDATPSDADVAAWLIYINKTCYNGLYRVNSKNVFNVPFGAYVNPTICDESLLRACSKILQNAEIISGDFEEVIERSKPGDFVYFDPPYVPLSATSSFTSYTSSGFGPEEQKRLRDVALALKESGRHVLLSNSSAGLVRELYSSDFAIVEVQATRMVNTKAEMRGKIAELLMV